MAHILDSFKDNEFRGSAYWEEESLLLGVPLAGYEIRWFGESRVGQWLK